MLCPEVWNFPRPAGFHDYKQANFVDDNPICDKIIKQHNFNHLISVVIPNTSTAPEDLTRILGEDSEYYKVQKVNISDLISKEFIEAFVKGGWLTILSDNTWIDIDDCMCITCSGQLILNLQRETYQKLGLEGRPSEFSFGKPARYIVTVDLCSPSFTPGKKNFDRTREVLRNNLHTFNVLLVWEPQDQNVCPSSVASYLHNLGYTVLLCQPRSSQYIEKEVMVPGFPEESKKDENEGNEEAEELMEWLGALLLHADLTSGSTDNFVTSYEPPSSCVMCKNVLVLEWRGFFSAQKIYKLYEFLRKFTEEQESKLWASLHVQGFMDSPVTWTKREHTFFTEGDNHYTLFLQPSRFLACSVVSSCRPAKSTVGHNK